MKPVDTNPITEAAAEAAAGLPDDKRLHFSASWGLCVLGTPFEKMESPDEAPSAFSLLKEGLDAWRVGVEKEFKDAGKDPAEAVRAMSAASAALAAAKSEADLAGLGGDAHETDLLADLAGIGLFLLAQGLQKINWRMGKYG